MFVPALAFPEGREGLRSITRAIRLRVQTRPRKP